MSESSDPADLNEGRPKSDDAYVVVARRYRPRSFDELVGQDHVGRALKNAIETNRVGHAYLFTGARGVGKTSTARIFAKALNDPSGATVSPDNDTDIARAIDSGEDVDVIEIDGASNRGIDEIRSLRANVGVRPSRSRFKIYIIDEVHMLTGAAFNALLKTLEEPPEHVKFIFCTTDPEKIPITVLSRCQRFDFAPVEVDKIIARLREIVTSESANADDPALELIARRAAGSMRDSQSLLEQVLSFSDGNLTADQVHAMLGTADDERLHGLATAMADRDAAEALRQLDAGIDAGVDAGRLAEQLLGYFRDLMAVAVGCDPSLMRHTSASMYDELKQLSDTWGLQTVLAVVGLIDQTLVRIRHSVYARVLLESTLIQICNLPDLQNIADLAAASAVGGSRPVEKKNKSPLRPPHFDRPTQRPEKEPASVTAPTVEPAVATVAHADPSVASRPEENASVLVMEPANAAAEDIDAKPVRVEPDESVPPEPVPQKASADQPWTQEMADHVWHQVLGQLEGMTETLARSVQQVTPAGDDKLRLVFPAQSKLAMGRCELPEHKTALTEAVSRFAGGPITLDFFAAKAEPIAEEAPQPTGRSRMQRMKEIEENPMIKSCVELFDAEIVRIDKPR